MFANRIVDGHPICPMKGCGKPLSPGDNFVGEFSPEAMRRAFRDGMLAEPEGLVIAHNACVKAEA